MSLFTNQNAANVTEKETVTIGDQTWAKKNLAATYFRNGDPILIAGTSTQFSASGVAGIPACFPFYSTSSTATINQTRDRAAYAADYGYLYNYWALIDSRSIAPEGFRVPTATEFATLFNYYGGIKVAAGTLKESGSIHWSNNDSTGSDKEQVFNWLPGGRTLDGGGGGYKNSAGYFGTNTRSSSIEYIRYSAWSNYNNATGPAGGGLSSATEIDETPRKFLDGFSTRCLKIIEDYTPRTTISTQTWTSKNLDVVTYSDGTPILEASSSAQWVAAGAAKIGAYCQYEDSLASGSVYGKLYNWYAVAGIHNAASEADPTLRKSLAPVGYHIPTNAEWNILSGSLGGESVAGGKMREAGTLHWLSPNINATNSSYFTALPGGFRNVDGTFDYINNEGRWWSSTQTYPNYSSGCMLENTTEILYIFSEFNAIGLSVRCIEDIVTSPTLPTIETTVLAPEANTIYTTNRTVYDGGATITARGVVWDSSPNPTIALGTKTTTPSGSNTFNSIATGLSTSTPYYIRAYVSNSAGIIYGPEALATTTTADGLINHAYSVRKVTSSYSGDAMLVRRSSDNTSASIAFDVNGNLDTGSLLSFVGSDTGYVKTWYDQSGNGKHVTQATNTKQPIIVTNGVLETKNGRPAILFNSVSATGLARTDATIALNNLSSYVVTSITGETNSQSAYGLQSSNPNRYFFPYVQSNKNTAQIAYSTDTTAIQVSEYPVDNTLYSVQSTSTGITAYKNGILRGTFVGVNTGNSDEINVGYTSGISIFNNAYLNGTIQEIITHTGKSSIYTKSAEIAAYYSIQQI